MQWPGGFFFLTAVSAALLFALGCSGRTGEQPSEVVPETLRSRILAVEGGDFEVREISMDGKAVRVEIVFSGEPDSEDEIRRRTLNALRAIQNLIGSDSHLAVWSYVGNPLTLQGVAFYSSVSEQYIFRLPGELN